MPNRDKEEPWPLLVWTIVVVAAVNVAFFATALGLFIMGLF